MVDTKLRIHRKLKIKATQTRTPLNILIEVNSDAPWESEVRASLIPPHGRRSWGQLHSPL
jgi:hypothetical protein